MFPSAFLGDAGGRFLRPSSRRLCVLLANVKCLCRVLSFLDLRPFAGIRCTSALCLP